ncbi:MAG: transcription termination/antitermination factor NusG [Ruminococcaceae bacterium]|nr:transcription termination/antitermination factor NusG [Oscillospiraceae bacterium]
MSELSEAKWYVVHTYSGYENKVATDLEKMVENRKMQDLILDIKIPTETVKEVKEDKVREVERKIFPGYVLIKMIVTDDSWYVVRNTRGVTGFVGPGSEPVPLSEAEVAALGVDVRTVEVSYKVGELVKIIAGPLKGMEGSVISIDEENNVVSVKISMLGQEIPAEMELDQVTPAF